MKAFKAYDIRGIYPTDVNEELAYNVGKALVTFLQAKTIVVGRDCRESSQPLHKAFIKGVTSLGCSVIDLGLISTPQLYFKLYTDSSMDGGVMITASHNPKEYNGMKICKKHAIPLFGEYGFQELQEIIEKEAYQSVADTPGTVQTEDIQEAYTTYFKEKVKGSSRPLKLLIDCGNGMGTKEVRALRKIYPQHHIETMYEEMDGSFPNHEANPIVKEHMAELMGRMKTEQFDYGIGFDGDADRIAFFLDTGEMVSPDILTGVIGRNCAKAGEKVGFEVRTSQVVADILTQKRIIPLLYPSGRAFIMNRMREDKAVFAGEKSGHYFYQELNYTDSALYTLIKVLELVEDRTLNALVEPLEDAFVRSGEMNYKVKDADASLKNIEEKFFKKADKILKIDGVSVYTESYFFNVRKSNTEPLVRINIEGTGPQVVEEIQHELEKLLVR